MENMYNRDQISASAIRKKSENFINYDFPPNHHPLLSRKYANKADHIYIIKNMNATIHAVSVLE